MPLKTENHHFFSDNYSHRSKPSQGSSHLFPQKRPLTIAAVCLLSTLFLASPAPAEETAQETSDSVSTLNIMALSDFHGHISPVFSEGKVIEPGAAVLSCYIKKEREDNPLTSFVANGDNIGASPTNSMMLDDKPTLDVLNTMGLELSSLGNHEFDRGWQDISTRVSLDGTGQAAFPYLGANVTLNSQEEAQQEPRASLVQDRDGVRIGYVGAVTSQTAQLVSPDGIRGVHFQEEVEAVNKESRRLKESGEADIVIALIHEGFNNTDLFDDSIDAVIAGHTHEHDIRYGSEREGKEPLLLIQPQNYGMNIADIDIQYDKAQKKLLSVQGNLVNAEEIWDRCGETPDPEVLSIVDATDKEVEQQSEKVIGSLDVDLPIVNERGQESSSAHFIAQSLYKTLNSLADSSEHGNIPEALSPQLPWSELNVDLAMMHNGGVRAGMKAGEVRYKDVLAVQPFGNDIGIVELTGAQIRHILEEQWRETNTSNGNSNPNLMLGVSDNLSYTFDPMRPLGQRITSIELNDRPLKEDTHYRVSANSFLLNEGDGYAGFDTQSGHNHIMNTGLTDSALLSYYIKSMQHASIRHGSAGLALSSSLDNNQLSVQVASLLTQEEISAMQGSTVYAEIYEESGEIIASSQGVIQAASPDSFFPAYADLSFEIPDDTPHNKEHTVKFYTDDGLERVAQIYIG